ncbi:MAG: hypothetical protein ACRC2T_18675 [Thermoguttaceae bacterium]
MKTKSGSDGSFTINDVIPGATYSISAKRDTYYVEVGKMTVPILKGEQHDQPHSIGDVTVTDSHPISLPKSLKNQMP